MSSFVFLNTKHTIASGGFDLSPTTHYKIALLTDGIFNDLPVEIVSTYTKWSEISHFSILNSSLPIQPINYTNKVITGVSFGVDTDVDIDGILDRIIIADDVSYPLSTITASCAVILSGNNSNTINPTDIPIAAIDLRSPANPTAPVSSVNGTFRILLSNGFLVIK